MTSKNLARRSGRPTDELHQLYALEGFIDRLVRSLHADRFVLKGGMLLAAFDTRRRTRDVDLAARALDNDLQEVRRVVAEIVTVDVDDGLIFEPIPYVRKRSATATSTAGCVSPVSGGLSIARLQFHVDINVGDPIIPSPGEVTVPRLLGVSFLFRVVRWKWFSPRRLSPQCSKEGQHPLARLC